MTADPRPAPPPGAAPSGAVPPSAEDERACTAAMAAAGIDVPPDLWAGVVRGYVELRAMAALLRGPRDPELEPAAVFRVDESRADG